MNVFSDSDNDHLLGQYRSRIVCALLLPSESLLAGLAVDWSDDDDVDQRNHQDPGSDG